MVIMGIKTTVHSTVYTQPCKATGLHKIETIF